VTVLIDTHCHLNHPDLAGDFAGVLHRAAEAGVDRIVCVGFDLSSSALAVRLARETRVVYATVGVHPHDAEGFGDEDEERLTKLAEESKKVVAIGETGLDYFRNFSPREEQREAYRRHIRLARELNLPLVVHSRDAGGDVLSALQEEGLPPRGVILHCFSGDLNLAREALELGCYLGIAGPITFQNAEAFRQVVMELALDRLLLETDAPYLAPHPHRGERNEPAYLRLVADKLADVKGLSLDEAAAQTTSNASRLFGL